MLIAMKVSATGMPMNSSSVEPPSISHAASCQLIGPLAPGRPPGERALPERPFSALGPLGPAGRPPEGERALPERPFSAHDALTASARGPRSLRARRCMRNTISIASSTNTTGSGDNHHHSGVTSVLMLSAPAL